MIFFARTRKLPQFDFDDLRFFLELSVFKSA